MIYVNPIKDFCFKTACVLLLSAACVRTLVIQHIYYILLDAALLMYLFSLDYAQFRSFDKQRKLIYIAIFLFNIYLAIDIILHHDFYSIVSVFFNDAIIPSLLVFLLTLNDYRFMKLYVKHVNIIAWLAIIIYPFAWWNSAEIAILYLVFRLICYPNRIFFRGMRMEKIFEFLSIYFVSYAGLNGHRFNLLFMLIIYSYLFAKIILNISDKRLWKCYAAIPPLFAILLYGFGLSLFDVNTYNFLDKRNDLYQDTRTFLYQDVIETLSDDGNLLFGSGLEGRITTSAFDDTIDSTIDLHGRRISLEANLPDLMRRGGFVYLFVYLLLFYCSSYRLLKSRNDSMRAASFVLLLSLSGSLVSLYHRLDAITALLMLTIALSNSDRLIYMTNKDFELWKKRKVLTQK